MAARSEHWRFRTTGLRFVFGLMLSALLTLVACRPPPEPLRVGVLAWPPYDLAHLAVDRELLDADRFRLVDFQTPAEIVRSFRYGLIDAMFVTSQFALSALRDIGEVRIVYIIDVSAGGDGLLARSSIDSADKMRGIRVGVEASPLGMYTLIRALGELGLSTDDIQVVYVDTPDHYAAWREGDVDALVTYEPTRSLVLRDDATELFSSSSMPFEIIDVLVVRASTVEARRGDLVELVRGLDAALHLYRDDPETVSTLRARRHPLSADAFRQAMANVELFDLEDNARLLSGRDNRVAEGLLQQGRVMLSAGMLVTAPDLEPLLDPSIVQQATAQ